MAEQFPGLAEIQPELLAHHYTEAMTALDEFLRRAPRNDLAPNAHLERARALTALERPADAAEAASQVLDRYPKSPLVGRALALRAEARFASGDFERARIDFHALGTGPPPACSYRC